MTGDIRYRKDGSDRIAGAPTPEAAIETACHFIDEGCDVYGVGAGPPADTIAGNETAGIYAIWAGEKHPFCNFQT